MRCAVSHAVLAAAEVPGADVRGQRAGLAGQRGQARGDPVVVHAGRGEQVVAGDRQDRRGAAGVPADDRGRAGDRVVVLEQAAERVGTGAHVQPQRAGRAGRRAPRPPRRWRRWPGSIRSTSAASAAVLWILERVPARVRPDASCSRSRHRTRRRGSARRVCRRCTRREPTPARRYEAPAGPAGGQRGTSHSWHPSGTISGEAGQRQDRQARCRGTARLDLMLAQRSPAGNPGFATLAMLEGREGGHRTTVPGPAIVPGSARRPDRALKRQNSHVRDQNRINRT